MIYVMILLILFIVFYLYPVIIYWTNKMIDHYILIFKFGKMGVGKTGDIAKQAMKDNLDPRFDRVYSSVRIPNTYYFDPKDLESGTVSFPPRSSVYIDEISLIWHSRDFSKFPPQLRKWFKMMRQSKVKLTIYSQSPDVDKAIRDLCMEYHILSRFLCFTVDWLVEKKIDVGEDRDGNGQLVDAFYKLPLIGGVSLNLIPRYIGLWNSFDPPHYGVINSEFVPDTREYHRRESLFDWYCINFPNAYSWIYGRCSAARQLFRAAKLKVLSLFKGDENL